MKKRLILIIFLFVVFSFSGCKEETKTQLNKESETSHDLTEFLGTWKGAGEDSKYTLNLTQVSDGYIDIELFEGSNRNQKYSDCPVESVSEGKLYLLFEDLRLSVQLMQDEMMFMVSVNSHEIEATAKPIMFKR